MQFILSLLLLLNLSLKTHAQDFLILCNTTNSTDYSKLSLSDEGTYFLLQGFNQQMEWEEITYFSDLLFSRGGQISFKSEESWSCKLGNCFRNEYFNFNKDSLTYKKSIKSDTYIMEEVLLSRECLFDFPNI